MKSTVEIFKALAEPNRVRILAVLTSRPACVCELAQALSLNQPNLSRHLRVLEAAGLVKSRRAGAWTDYTLNRNRETAPFVRLLKNLASADEALQRDLKALAKADRLRIKRLG
ncbi:MAG: metalloregulator ArsR/SmtB family transcription factor [candidate division Zixibacteria bacterium]|nr:metalloregulator ArsR/SmtB family transcription factor [candidate division Zixibacteria bacterium]